MPLTIRRPIQIDLDTDRQQDAEERERAKLTELMKRVQEKLRGRQEGQDFGSRIIERAEEIRDERESREGVAEPTRPDFRSVGPSGGGIRGALGDIGRGALGAGRAAVRGIDVGLEAVAPFAGKAAETVFGGLPIVGTGGPLSLGRETFRLPDPQTGGNILDFRGPPTAAQVGQATEFTFRNPLEAAQREVEFGRPLTEPAGRFLARGAVEVVPGGQAVDILTGGKLSDIAEDIGGVVGPELAVLSNAVPVEAALFVGPKLLFRGTRVTSRALEVLARVARGGVTMDTIEAGVKVDLAKFADEAAEAVSLGDIPPRTEAGQPFRDVERFDVPTEDIAAETRIPPGVSREAPLTGQQVEDLPVGQVELPFPRTRDAQEIAQLAGERRNNLKAVQEGAEAGSKTADDVQIAENGLAVARQEDNAARIADVDDLTKRSFTELIDDARRACRG